MGYYVEMYESTAYVPKEHLDRAYDILCELNDHDELKTGGAFSGGEYTQKWFSWMDANYPDTCSSAGQILSMVGFECVMEEDGLHITYYNNKTGCESVFIEALAPVMANGTAMDWVGEEGERYRWEFRDGECFELAGVVTYDRIVTSDGMSAGFEKVESFQPPQRGFTQ